MPRTDFHGRDTGNSYARFLYLGFTFILILGIFTVLGFFADRLFGTLPLFLLVGLGTGFAAALYYLFRSLGDLGGG
jgi:F0F1-type ATP synthase assembly protein I